jgi:anthranilate synthase component 1
VISLSEVEDLARTYNVIPVTKRLFAGTETPVGLYHKLCGRKPNTFLLESAEQGVWGRFSFIGVGNRGRLSATDVASWDSVHQALPDDAVSSDPIDALRQLQNQWKSSPSDYPLTSGLVGFISWGLTERLENLPARKQADYPIPLYSFLQFSELVIVDHQNSELVLVCVIFVDGEASIEAKYRKALKELSELENALREPTPALISPVKLEDESYTANTPRPEFLAAVEKAKDYVRIGDVFQVVISQRFDQEFHGDALDVYRALRASNPSPYMYLIRMQDEQGDFDIVGSSPEALIKVSAGKVITHPIAGSRPRGATATEDARLANELLVDDKERSEHLMLVDLSRNDLLRVCQPDTLQVSEFMQIHRFSHVMHLVSTVEGQLRQDLGALDALLAAFPAGTLSGAPKPRALEIISELESTYRGLFGGVVGYFDFAGNSDLAIAIRTTVIRDGKSHVQAGAGIVLDSIAESEYQETLSKAAVVIKSVAKAKGFLDG